MLIYAEIVSQHITLFHTAR